VHNRLRKQQGDFIPKPALPIIDELIVTLLSQHTSDVNRDRAFRRLRERFPTWEEVLIAPTEDIADAIRPGGIANQKAARIKAILAEIEGREGSLDLSGLSRLSDREVEEYLCGLPGVGPKTAACVLVFSMGREAFPIDTHVHRIVKRLGWIEETDPAERAHSQLTPRIPRRLRYSLHMALIRHGREVCKPQRPRCIECVLLDLCDAGPRFVGPSEV
jgi:endonuclease-3